MNTKRTSEQNRETERRLIEFFQAKTSEEIISAKNLDIRSLVASVSEIDGEKIFIAGKKKHGGMLNVEKFLK